MEELRGDWSSGATDFLERAIEAVERSRNPLDAVEEARRVRPGMGSLDFLWLVVKKAFEEGVDIRLALRRLREYVGDAKRRLDTVIPGAGCYRTIATISSSRAVARFVEISGCVEKVYLLESRPGAELGRAFETLGKYAEVVFITDSAAGAFSYDAAVIGLDGMYLDYAVNKVGSLPLLAAAKALGAKTLAVFESYKAVPLAAPEPIRVQVEILGRKWEIPLFDKIPRGLIDLYVTDAGVLNTANPLELFNQAVGKIFTGVDIIR